MEIFATIWNSLHPSIMLIGGMLVASFIAFFAYATR